MSAASGSEHAHSEQSTCEADILKVFQAINFFPQIRGHASLAMPQIFCLAWSIAKSD